MTGKKKKKKGERERKLVKNYEYSGYPKQKKKKKSWWLKVQKI